MATNQAVHHSLLRPCILHILRAAGYHSTRPSVLDTLTDIAGRYMLLLASATADHANLNQNALEITIQDVRMAMQDCGAIAPEKILEDEIFDDEEDTRGVDQFLDWVTGSGNKEIRRVALEGGDEGKDDYLAALKRKHDNTGEEGRYQGTILGKAAEPRAITVEGGEIGSLKEWAESLQKRQAARATDSATPSRRPSSELSSLGDEDMEGMDFS